MFPLITSFFHEIISEIIYPIEKDFPGFIMREKNNSITHFLNKYMIAGKLKFFW